jgi:hypothetical protein
MDGHFNIATDLIEYDDYWLIPIAGASVSKLVFDLALKLEFIDAKQEDTLVWIGGDIQLKMGGTEYTLQGDNAKELAPILGLWGALVDFIKAHKDGRLEIRFKAGNTLSAYPQPTTEAWGLTGQRWLRIVCMPGGDLAVWIPENPLIDDCVQGSAEERFLETCETWQLSLPI